MIALLLAAIFLQAGAQPGDSARLRWVPNPRAASGGWVADPARHLTPATVDEINAIITALERETSTEIGVAVLDSLDGLEPAQAALLLHRRWGVGKRERDNGIVFLWSPRLRQTYVSIGYGLEGVLPDARAGRIQDQHVIPAFRGGNFDAGVVAGVRALADAAREETFTGPRRAKIGDRTGFSPVTALGTILGVPLTLLAGALAWRSRPRRCPRGHGRMRRLSETEDNQYLAAESNLEERLGSMNYHVWLCDACAERIVVGRRKWFSGYGACPTCKRRTLQTTKKTLRAATYSSSGRRLVTRNCRNCRHFDSREETIPQLSDSSSGGSSGGGGGGSSFGGGSSGGGGAGRSY